MHHEQRGFSMRSIVILVLLISGSSALAMSPFKKALEQKNNAYVSDGLFTGGQAGAGSTLLGVRRSFSKKAQIERIIIDMGDREAKPIFKQMGYFQASVDQKNQQIVLDLSQLKMSRLSEPQIKEVFKNSPYVATAEFTADPQDRSGSIVLKLKRPMKLEVFELKGGRKPARIVMDLTPLPTPPPRGQL